MAETVLNQQEPKIESTTDARQQSNSLKRIIGIILLVILVGVSAFVMNLQYQNAKVLTMSNDLALNAGIHQASNYRTYVHQYKETKIQLDETTRKLEEVNRQLDQVTIELATTKGMLSETQAMLSQAQEESSKLKLELQGLDMLRASENVQNIGELKDKIQVLKEKDSQVSAQLVELKNQLRAFEAEFSNLEEGKSLITLFQNKIRLVKTRMNYLKQETYFTKIAAQKEKDRLELLNGNSGFMVRNGEVQKPNAGNKSFAIDVKIVQ